MEIVPQASRSCCHDWLIQLSCQTSDPLPHKSLNVIIKLLIERK